MKPVILTGDLNCAHEEIDIYNPAVSSAYIILFIYIRKGSYYLLW